MLDGMNTELANFWLRQKIAEKKWNIINLLETRLREKRGGALAFRRRPKFKGAVVGV